MNSTTSLLSIGVCAFGAPLPTLPRGNVYAAAIGEVLAHAGLCHSAIEPDALEAALPQLRLLVTIGEGEFTDSCKETLRAWVEAGGAWLSVAGTCGVAHLFGVENQPPAFSVRATGPQPGTLGEGYLTPGNTGHPVLDHLEIPLHFFNGVSVLPAAPTDAAVIAGVTNSHQQATPRCGVVEQQTGRGRCLLVAPDAVGAIVRITQGVAITRDGVPAPDGTSPVTDGVLKCDDGAVLDWPFDRQDVPGAPGLKAFLQPVADQWRELILRSIFHLAKEQQVPLPLLWLYPRNLPALAHMSFDSDGNDPERAQRLLQVLQQAGIATTWCIILPGYEAEMLARIENAGHELATHYDALEHPWSEDSFDEQWRALCRQLPRRPVSNKNHYTRWEGDTEFFQWCRQRGIELDQSKGPSKVGEVGFIFGTCHPYFPVTPEGTTIEVLELPFFTQDLVVFAPPAVRTPLRENALKAHGVLHMLFHPAHINTPGVAEALLETVLLAQAAGLEWWTATAINTWERARRQVEWQKQSGSENALQIALCAGESLPEATLLFLQTGQEKWLVDGVAVDTASVTRWGFEFACAVHSLPAGNACLLETTTAPVSGS
jgi:hypothetical protein